MNFMLYLTREKFDAALCHHSDFFKPIRDPENSVDDFAKVGLQNGTWEILSPSRGRRDL